MTVALRFLVGVVAISAAIPFLATQDLAAAERLDPKMAAPSDDGKTLWYDCKALGVEGQGWTDTQSDYDRLPARAEGKVTERVWGLSHNSSGLCFRFKTDAPKIQVRWTLTSKNIGMPHLPATGVSGLDLYARPEGGAWRYVSSKQRPESVTNACEFKPPAGQELLLYLPLYNGVKSIEIGVAPNESLWKVDPPAKPRKTIVFYGTSITQGGCASRPGMNATAIAGRKLDATVINLGFSGAGRTELPMAELLAELNPDVYVIDPLWNMEINEINERMAAAVKIIRAKHPNTPIVLVEDSSVYDASPTSKGRLLKSIVDQLVAEGVKHLYFLPSKGMLGDDGEGTVDGVHPNDLGMMRQADVFVEFLRPILDQTH